MKSVKIEFDRGGRFGQFAFPVCFELGKCYCADADYQLIVSFLWWAARWFIWTDRKERDHV